MGSVSKGSSTISALFRSGLLTWVRRLELLAATAVILTLAVGWFQYLDNRQARRIETTYNTYYLLYGDRLLELRQRLNDTLIEFTAECSRVENGGEVDDSLCRYVEAAKVAAKSAPNGSRAALVQGDCVELPGHPSCRMLRQRPELEFAMNSILAIYDLAHQCIEENLCDKEVAQRIFAETAGELALVFDPVIQQNRGKDPSSENYQLYAIGLREFAPKQGRRSAVGASLAERRSHARRPHKAWGFQ